MLSRLSSLYSVCCAVTAVARMTTATALKINWPCRIRVRIGSPSEVEVKAHENAVAVQRGCRQRRGSLLLNQGVLGVIGEAGPAEHERIVAESERVGVHIAEVPRRGGQSLLAHPHELIALDEDHLRIEDIVGFYESTVP